MAKIIGKTTAKFDNAEFENAVNNILLAEVRKRKDRIRSSVNRRVRTVLKRMILNSPIIKSIQGEGGVHSLKAEFGLSTYASRVSPKKISDMASKSVKSSITERRVGNRSIIDIDILGLDSESLKNSINTNEGPLSYTSEPQSPGSRDREIKWMELILNPSVALIDEFIPDIHKTVGDKMYGIFRGPAKGSRSGMALMKLSRNPHNFPYRIPKLIIPVNKKSKHFLDDVVTSKSFTKQVREIIRDVIQREMSR
jgi:hypothetical protein